MNTTPEANHDWLWCEWCKEQKPDVRACTMWWSRSALEKLRDDVMDLCAPCREKPGVVPDAVVLD
jgi:hypothetical protein